MKAYEDRMRRVAKRRGLELVKSARRDQGALDYGLYAVVRRDTPIHPRGPLGIHALTLAQVEQLLNSVDDGESIGGRE
ncbi:hypothetical protein EOA33_32690 [Mesorhizobium sp. M4A.F.Ca.ET.050.02.1.1]|uniref:hypothetical protein n=1 Tax=Mesorhizobium sp. M4A.F.Ca.ET.050.02.1.1 TaxID=2496754 RepID=UPI000FCA1AE7|nr:hypothetical protein [Mesorhizobium sp. M4A.F.Ca.ET.050.02.1.1]RUX42141.1 hypothetical protein EOA33_32690 [Mesorhizobium sp. M4A.F.Ca.ET.050.02.1.1]